ncbi:MAG TPA: CopG family transcriptional regulator [Aquabacterium sp.]|nr:CopG family transcriptional regulator [Aquabacterium sp.]
MAQITLYIDDATQAKLREAAAQRKVSQSQFVADLIRRATDDAWPAAVLALAGSIPDFPLAEELRAGLAPDPERDL